MNETSSRLDEVRAVLNRKPAEIYLDRDAISLRGWLSRQGRRLLERPGYLMSEADGWKGRPGARSGLAGLPC
jgi:hypothetical protein